MNEKTKVSLVGLGRWGKNHLRVLHENLRDDVSIVVYDSSQDVADYWGNFYNGITVAHNINEAIDSTDATIIATPANSHFRIAREAIMSGNDVLIEKPLTIKTDGSTALIGDAYVARKNGKQPIAMVDHILLYSEAVNKIMDIIESGEIGDPVYYRAERTHFGWAVPSETAVSSLMIHDIYTIEHLLGDKIYKLGNVSSVRNLDDVTAHGTMRNGTEFSLRASWIDFNKSRTIQITGTKRTIVWDDDKKEIHIFPFSAGEKVVRGEGDTVVHKICQTIEPLEVVIRHFLNCVKTREEPLSGLIEGRYAVFTCSAIEAKAREEIKCTL